MASRRELIESEDFARRRGVAALVRGDALAIEDVPRRPNAGLLVGLVVVVLAAAVSAGSAFLTGRAPDGWRDDGTLVVDRETGARYLATGGLLRPAPTLTAALLAGARRDPVLVPHGQVLGVPVGTALPDAGAPEIPPALPARPPPLAACASAAGQVAVFTGTPAGDARPETGFLARPAGGTEIVLLTGGRAHHVEPAALPALGYAPAQVRDVPAAWLALLPRGGDLAPTPAPGPVVETSAGSRYVLDRGRARQIADGTSARLFPTPARTVDPEEVLALPAGPPIGVPDVPSEPPAVPARESAAVACVVGGGESPRLLVLSAAVDTTTRPAPERVLGGGARPLRVTWHVPPGGGALLAPPEFDHERPPSGDRDDPMVLVDGGLGFPVADDEALRALGYDRGRVLPIGRPWFALLGAGPRLAVPG
ncbi:type VII secretion protein EccB [Actinomycetospora endophytica]|uniref:Type VII secretion protein EccB n=1 Tax=Actinomycetospora endophytica TaxID=2291215 RepID=A0ABS8P1Z8_9PSEU|nr:type VII secretion protein EccB [Actinomycetospora endophytica]MCD2192254.1 type VII secretion protein EccB [Actinomycetospora endophytica]